MQDDQPPTMPCQTCGYNLATLCTFESPMGDCPECGAPYLRSRIIAAQRQAATQTRWLWLLGLSPGMVAAVLVGGGLSLRVLLQSLGMVQADMLEILAALMWRLGFFVLFTMWIWAFIVATTIARRSSGHLAGRRPILRRDETSTQVFAVLTLAVGQFLVFSLGSLLVMAFFSVLEGLLG